MRWQRNGTVGILVSLAVAMILGACGKDGLLDLQNDPPLTRISEVTEGDPTKFVGRKVDFDRLTASRAVGDYVFWAGEGGDELPIVLESELNGTGTENAVQIVRGRRYHVQGSLRTVDNVPDDSRIWRLMRPAQIAEVRRVGVYIGADTVTEE